jgi:hypothetical protein
MAEGKKSFIAYSDWNGMFQALPDDVAGKLIKYIFSYVNDENPQTDDYVIKALFEPIKQTLKRDLVKWETQQEQRKLAGLRSAEVRKRNSTSVNERSISSTVSVSVSDSVSDSVNVNEKTNKKESTKVVFPFHSEKFDFIWNVWKDYKKKQFRFIYKTPISEQAALKKLNELSNGNENKAIEIIEQSIANGWSGIFELKNNGKNEKSNYNNELIERLSHTAEFKAL